MDTIYCNSLIMISWEGVDHSTSGLMKMLERMSDGISLSAVW